MRMIGNSGDPCACKVYLCNPGSESYDQIPLFALLEVYGTYYFAPDFTDFDYYTGDLPPGQKEVTILNEFLWPENVGSAEGIIWFSAMTDPEITEIFGEMDSWEFGWGP